MYYRYDFALDYTNNQISKYESKAFCPLTDHVLKPYGRINFFFDSIEKVPTCMLGQPNDFYYNVSITVKSTPPDCDCQLVRWAQQQYNVMLKGYECTTNCNNSAPLVDIYGCQDKPEYKCNSTVYLRFTSWLTGDPHIHSYYTNYEICSFDEREVVCLKTGWLTIYCTDKKVLGAASPQATLLSKIRIEFNLDGVKYSYEANETSWSNTFTVNATTQASDILNANNEVSFKSRYIF
jgi:hypothetical protein